jgi:prophage regulatory protein
MLGMTKPVIGMGELMRMLGVSRTRAVQLSSEADFPVPFAELMMGKVWRTTDVEQWAERRGRDLHPLVGDTSS